MLVNRADKLEAALSSVGASRNTTPMISVVIPSYNCAEFLPQALDSVLIQSYSVIEIIIVDDGSTDETRQIVQPYLGRQNIRYVYQENRGLPGARNRGVEESRGEFIAVLDADDALAPTALEEMLHALSDSDASWCVIDIVKFWEDYREIQKTDLPKDDLRIAILNEDFIRRAMFFRKVALQRIGMWDASMKMREDWDLNIRLISGAEPFVYVARPLYHYRRRPGSITTGSSEKLFSYTERLLAKHHKASADAGDTVLRRIYAERMWDLARLHLYNRRDWKRALHCVCQSLAYDFSFARLIHPILHRLRLAAH